MTKQEAIQKLSQDGWCFKTMTKFHDDRDVILVAVSVNGYNLSHVSKKLRDNRNIVLTAVINQPMALQYASTRLKKDKELQKIAIHKREDVIKYLTNYIDKELAIYAIEKNPCMVKFIPYKIKRELGYVTKYIVQMIKRSYQFSKKELKQNITQDPINDEYYYMIARIYEDEMKYKKAYFYYSEAIKHDKYGNLDYISNLANISSLLNNHTESKELYLKVIELDGDMFGPVAIEAFKNLAYINYQEKDYLNAILNLGVYFVNADHVEDEEYELYNKIYKEHISKPIPTIGVQKDEIQF